MRQQQTRFSLKLSRETIQLLLKGDGGQFEEIGSADPNNNDINHNLNLLQKQVYALSNQKPLIDVMLPDELILVQNLNITASDEPISVDDATKLIADTCELSENEINVAIGSRTSPRTQPVAAVTSKTLHETRDFLNNAGFTVNRFMASNPMSGFLEPPIFNDATVTAQPILKSKNLTTIGTILTTCALVSFAFIFFFQPFVPPETPHRIKHIPHADVPAKISNSYKKGKNYDFSISPALPTSIEHSKGLELPKIPSKKFIGETIFSENALNQPKINSLRISDQLSEDYPKINFFSNLELKTKDLLSQPPVSNLSSIFIYLPNYLVQFPLLNQYTKLRDLKSSIQTDYLKSVQTDFDSDEKEASIKKLHNLQSPNHHETEFIKNPRMLGKPELSVLDKIKRKFLAQPHNIEAEFAAKLAKESIQHTSFQKNSSLKLGPPQILLKEDKLLEDQNYQNLVKFGFRQLTPSEILLSKQYEPIFRPDLISKINVLVEPTLSSGAVTLSQNPIARPQSVQNLTQLKASDVKIIAKATRKPSFPRRASIVNNATIANIMELNRTNLIGVFGTKEDAIALIRLSSGRIIKVRVGDRFSGWKVLTIYEDKIELANGNKQEILRLPG